MIRCFGQKRGVLRGNGDPALFGGNAGRSVRFGFSAEKMELFRDRIISAGEEGIGTRKRSRLDKTCSGQAYMD